jgi:hypothetical protein
MWAKGAVISLDYAHNIDHDEVEDGYAIQWFGRYAGRDQDGIVFFERLAWVQIDDGPLISVEGAPRRRSPRSPRRGMSGADVHNIEEARKGDSGHAVEWFGTVAYDAQGRFGFAPLMWISVDDGPQVDVGSGVSVYFEDAPGRCDGCGKRFLGPDAEGSR